MLVGSRGQGQGKALGLAFEREEPTHRGQEGMEGGGQELRWGGGGCAH